MLKIDRNMRVIDMTLKNKHIGNISFDRQGKYKFVKRSHKKISPDQEYEATWLIDDLNTSFGEKRC